MLDQCNCSSYISFKHPEQLLCQSVRGCNQPSKAITRKAITHASIRSIFFANVACCCRGDAARWPGGGAHDFLMRVEHEIMPLLQDRYGISKVWWCIRSCIFCSHSGGGIQL